MADKDLARKRLQALKTTKQRESRARERQSGAVEQGTSEGDPLHRFKIVKLFHTEDPEKAKAAQIPETPALVSPYTQAPADCPRCAAGYRPLVYGVGHTTRTAHTGEDCPGIFVTKDQPFRGVAPGEGLLSGIVESSKERTFTGTRAHYLMCEGGFPGCEGAALSGSITRKGKVSCPECRRPTHPIDWEITEDNGNGGHLMFRLSPEASERSLQAGGLEERQSLEEQVEGMDLDKIAKKLEQRIKRMQGD